MVNSWRDTAQLSISSQIKGVAGSGNNYELTMIFMNNPRRATLANFLNYKCFIKNG
jgi:hypothetical protein